MDKPSVLVVGYGTVGRNLKKMFYWADVYDPNVPPYDKKENKRYDFAFVAVPTPMMDSGRCDVSFVEKAISETDAEIVIIKSTVEPGTTDRLRKETGRRIIFSPEYEGGTQHANAVDYDFAILGGQASDTEEVAQLYQHAVTGYYKIHQTDALTAEIAKYMENAFLATKVVFVNEFYRIAKAFGVNYSELRELWLLDRRIGRSHTFVYKDQPYYDSHCLNKDIPAIIFATEAAGYRPDFLNAVVKTNARFKEEQTDSFV